MTTSAWTSNELVEIIEESWARELVPPTHLPEDGLSPEPEARAGLTEFAIPHEFRGRLLGSDGSGEDRRRHLNRRGGVLIGDVVGLGN